MNNEKKTSSEYRKTAHDGDFVFKNSTESEHSLNHEEVKKELERQRDELLRQLYGVSDSNIEELDDIPRKSR